MNNYENEENLYKGKTVEEMKAITKNLLNIDDFISMAKENLLEKKN